MNKFVLEPCLQNFFHAGSKAREDINFFLGNNGYEVISFKVNDSKKFAMKVKNYISCLMNIDDIVDKVKPGSMVLLQYPYSCRSIVFDALYKKIRKKGSKVVALVHVFLKTDYKEVIGDINFERLIYTGSIDYFFDYKHGRLKYRGIRFEYETLDCNSYQDASVVNYPNDYDFTRITEFKKLTGQRACRTTIMREYPTWDGEPYYPYPVKECSKQYDLYKQECDKQDKVIFIGRLAEYKYYDMDAVVKRALDAFDSEVTGKA